MVTLITLDDQGKRAYKVGGKLLGNLKLIGDEIRNAAQNIAEHDTDQRHQNGVLELDALDEPHKDPCA